MHPPLLSRSLRSCRPCSPAQHVQLYTVIKTPLKLTCASADPHCSCCRCKPAASSCLQQYRHLLKSPPVSPAHFRTQFQSARAAAAAAPHLPPTPPQPAPSKTSSSNLSALPMAFLQPIGKLSHSDEHGDANCLSWSRDSSTLAAAFDNGSLQAHSTSCHSLLSAILAHPSSVLGKRWQ